MHRFKGKKNLMLKSIKIELKRKLTSTETTLHSIKLVSVWAVKRLLKGCARITDKSPSPFESNLGPLHPNAPYERWDTPIKM